MRPTSMMNDRNDNDNENEISRKERKKLAVIFDFDCTLSSKHVYHFLNAHSHYLRSFHFPYLEAMGIPPSSSQRLEELKGISTTLRRLQPLMKESDRSLFINECFHGERRIQALKDFLFTLQKNFRADLFIASRGEKQQILHCLREIDPVATHINASPSSSSSRRFCPSTLSSFFPPERVFGQTEINKADLIKFLLGSPSIRILPELQQSLSRDYEAVLYIDDCQDEHKEVLNTFWMQRLPSKSKTTTNTLSLLAKEFEIYQTRHGKLYIYCKALDYNGTGLSVEIMKDCLSILNDYS